MSCQSMHILGVILSNELGYLAHLSHLAFKAFEIELSWANISPDSTACHIANIFSNYHKMEPGTVGFCFIIPDHIPMVSVS